MVVAARAEAVWVAVAVWAAVERVEVAWEVARAAAAMVAAAWEAAMVAADLAAAARAAVAPAVEAMVGARVEVVKAAVARAVAKAAARVVEARVAARAEAARVGEMVGAERVEAVRVAAAVVEMERAVVEMERVVAARVVAVVAAAMEAATSEAAVREAVVTGSAVTGWAVAVARALVRAAVGRYPTLAGRRGAERGYEEGESSLTEALTSRSRPLAGPTRLVEGSQGVRRSPIALCSCFPTPNTTRRAHTLRTPKHRSHERLLLLFSTTRAHATAAAAVQHNAHNLRSPDPQARG